MSEILMPKEEQIPPKLHPSNSKTTLENNAQKIIDESREKINIKFEVINNLEKNYPNILIAKNQIQILTKILDNYPINKFSSLSATQQQQLEKKIMKDFIQKQIDYVTQVEKKYNK